MVVIFRGVSNDFYPRPPRGGRHAFTGMGNTAARFLPTPSARRATVVQHEVGRRVVISTHALREEGDSSLSVGIGSNCLFLPTPSARRATRALMGTKPATKHFYPRPPRGGRPCSAAQTLAFREISTHALREEGDVEAQARPCARILISTHALREEGDHACRGRLRRWPPFLPTPSARRATGSRFRRRLCWK